jgi:hypothetical protein
MGKNQDDTLIMQPVQSQIIDENGMAIFFSERYR